MKFLHTSDWHLGAAEGDFDLSEDQSYFIDAICRIAQEKQVDAILLAGDVYDRSLASADAVRLYDYAMTRLCGELGIPVLTIAGNHDSAQRLSSCAELLEKAGLYVCGALEAEPKAVSFDDCQVFLLPWIMEEKVKSLYPGEADSISSLTDAYRTVTAHMRSQFAPNKRHILMAHAFITDSETSESDRAAVIGFATQVSASVFDGFDYVALGHIHKPQNVTECIRYCGTPMPYSFGKEEAQEKSVTILDTASMEQEIVPLPQLHKWTSITDTYDALLKADYPEDVRSGYTRLTATDTAVGLELLSSLRQLYDHAQISGKTYDGENSTITLTMEELEQMESDPCEVFKSFCREEIKEEASEHFLALFRDAVQSCGEEIE